MVQMTETDWNRKTEVSGDALLLEKHIGSYGEGQESFPQIYEGLSACRKEKILNFSEGSKIC